MGAEDRPDTQLYTAQHNQGQPVLLSDRPDTQLYNAQHNQGQPGVGV